MTKATKPARPPAAKRPTKVERLASDKRTTKPTKPRANVKTPPKSELVKLDAAGCDAGTALRTVWQYGEVIGDDEALKDAASGSSTWNFGPLLAAIKQRFAKGFATSAIRFDPSRNVGMFPGGAAELRGYGVSEHCLHAVGNRDVAFQEVG